MSFKIYIFFSALKNNYSGYDIDFEPTTAATQQDAQDYATFLSQFADALHAKNKQLQVCVAHWNIFWNYTAISLSTVDLIITMDTYASSFNTFSSALDRAVKEIGIKKLGVGLDSDDNKYSSAMLDQIFKKIVSVNANQVR